MIIGRRGTTAAGDREALYRLRRSTAAGKGFVSKNSNEIVRSALVLIAALILGLTTAWIIVREEKAETPVGPLEQVLHPQS